MTHPPGEAPDTSLEHLEQRLDNIQKYLAAIGMSSAINSIDLRENPELLERSRHELYTFGGRIARIAAISSALDSDIARITEASPVLAEATLAPAEYEDTPEIDSHDFYERITRLNQVPIVQSYPEEENIAITITSDKTVIINDQTIELTGHQLYLFNAFLVTRSQPRKAYELQAFGFAPSVEKTQARNAAFFRTMSALSDGLNRAARKEIIKKIGVRSKMMYAFNPRVIFKDERLPEAA